MNFLAICQRLREECGVAGTGPTTVIGQAGELQRLVQWAAAAYDEIQEKHFNWRWLRSSWTVNTVLNDDSYAPADCTDVLAAAAITRFRNWWPFDEEGAPNVQIYKQSEGVATERRMSFMSLPSYRYQYRLGSPAGGLPSFYAIDPKNNLLLGPKPDGVYVVSGEYQKSGQTLALDADVPEMPDRFHLLVVYRAMEKYGAFKAAAEVFTRAQYEGSRLMTQLELDQLPDIALAGPMA